MARGVNKVILLGNVAAAPDFRVLPSGSVSVATVSLATNESFKDAQGNIQERVEWHRVVFWGRLAEIARDYVVKGAPIYVEGKIRTRSYDDQQGIKRYVTEIQASELQLLGSRNQNNSQQNFSTTSSSSPSYNHQGYNQPQNNQSNYMNQNSYVGNSSYSNQNSYVGNSEYTNPNPVTPPPIRVGNPNGDNNQAVPSPDNFELQPNNSKKGLDIEPALNNVTEDPLPF
ncbi:MAG: single-stranded DNA-binding protein [Succinivibrionaceae bacterium]